MRLTANMSILLAAGALSAGPGHAATELRARTYEPSSRWVLDYADERCTLARSFGTGDDTVLLRIDSFGGWNSFHVTVAGIPVPRSSTTASPGGYRLAGDQESRDVTLLFGTLDSGKTPAASFTMVFAPPGELPTNWQHMSDEQRGAYALRFEQPHVEFERSVDSVRIAFGKGSPIELHVGSMAQPLEAMRKCVADLYKSWGMDPAVERSLSRLPRPLPSTVKHVQQRYPGAALMQGLSAFVPVRLLIDANGEATSCDVQAPQTTSEFKQALCEGLTGKFVPALDSAGQPVASMYNTSVIYIVR